LNAQPAGVVARFARRLGHHVRVLERRRERFLAEDRRAGLEGGDRRFAMDVVRPEVVEDVHLVDNVSPVRRYRVEAEPFGGVRQRRLVAADEDAPFDLGASGKNIGSRAIAFRVRFYP